MRRGENIYRRKDKRWEGRYSVGKKANGKRKYRSVYGKSLQEVRQKLYPLKLKYQLIQETQGGACILLEEWGQRWLYEAEEHVKQSTHANYKHKLTHYVLPVIGNYALNELDEAAGLELLESLKAQELKASTIQVIFRIVNQCIHSAITKNLLKAAPFASVKLPKAVKNKHQALTKKEQKSLETIALTEKTSKGLPILLALHAGLRIGEASALAWQDIDFDDNTIHVHSTFQRVFCVLDKESKTELIHTSSKTEASARYIPMSGLLRELLLKHQADSTGEFVFSTKENPAEPRLLTYHFHKLRSKAKLEHIHFHQLRHTFATRCIESKGDIKSVSQLMGHSSAKLTLDTYTDSMLEQRIKVVKQMERAIS
ncbi:tyrosine-type recombinase/integrase [Enterococcus sp. AZ072]|uniref:tyrosine-type recombinase/integrase n=1 Tax=unclassified Enterococcus TaxID=2608891 RepID=UPI003D2790D1